MEQIIVQKAIFRFDKKSQSLEISLKTQRPQIFI